MTRRGAYTAGAPATVRELRAEGRSVREIAEHFGVTVGALKMWRHRYPRFRSAWFGEPDPFEDDAAAAVSQEEPKAPPRSPPRSRRAEVLAMLRSMVPEALRTLREVMRDPDAPPSTRSMIALALLDRELGKPRQAVELTGADGGPIETRDLTRVSERAAELLEEIAAALGKPELRIVEVATVVADGNTETRH